MAAFSEIQIPRPRVEGGHLRPLEWLQVAAFLKFKYRAECNPNEKTDGLGPLFEVPMPKNCTPLWREAHFQVKMIKKLAVSEHFLKFRCPKSARRCGAKYISKKKCTKYLCFAALFEVQTSKN